MKTINRTLQVIAIASQTITVSVAEEPLKNEPKSITQTYAKINAECDFKIVDARVIDLLNFVTQEQIPIDISEVEGALKAKDITLTIKANRWIDIVTHAADQIGASVLIGNGTIKLVPNEDAGTNQRAEESGAVQPATAPEEGIEKPQPESKVVPR